MKYNQFRTLCKEAWKTEGQGSNELRKVHDALLTCDKKLSMTKIEVITSAWNYYKTNALK